MRSFSNTLARRAIAGVLLGAALGGCSDVYTARRETILSGANDAVAANQVAQMVDPWPRAAANNSFSFNGEKMAGAAERYRTGHVIPPTGNASSQAYGQQQQAPSGGAPAGAPSTGQQTP